MGGLIFSILVLAGCFHLMGNLIEAERCKRLRAFLRSPKIRGIVIICVIGVFLALPSIYDSNEQTGYRDNNDLILLCIAPLSILFGSFFAGYALTAPSDSDKPWNPSRTVLVAIVCFLGGSICFVAIACNHGI